jgi:hypothetical protein
MTPERADTSEAEEAATEEQASDADVYSEEEEEEVEQRLRDLGYL